MVIEIDTQAKTMKIKGMVNLKELVDWLMHTFPDFEWENYYIVEYPVVPGTWIGQPHITTGSGILPQIIPTNPYTGGNIYIGDPQLDPNVWKITTGSTGTATIVSGSCACDENHL